MNKTIKNILIYAGIVLLFLGIAYSFVPEIFSGKVVNQSDITGFRSMAQEGAEWNAQHPEDHARWTGAMFSGMPNTTFDVSSKGDWTSRLYGNLMRGKRPANWLFLSLFGAFLLMLSLGIDKFLAIGGAIAVTFCSYNFQIIQVGHNTKMQAIAFLPWVLAAMIFTYRKALSEKRGWQSWLPWTLAGAVMFGLALSLQIKANHQQITYYLAIMIIIFVIALFLEILFSKKDVRLKVGRFFAASGLLLVVGLVGIGTNAIKLAPLYEYTQYTMRGGSELTHPSGKEVNNDGLQIDYATSWSYGWDELPNMMIPNFNGGASAGAIDPKKSEVIKLLRQAGQGNTKEVAKALPFYWGPQPFTAGPMYMGAITVFLFLLGLFLYKGKEKWWMLAATIVAIFLGLGSHFMWFTKLFFKYVPMYNKFRTVSMALVVLQFTLPMLGFLVLDRILKQEYTRKEFLKAGWKALVLTAGFCLICAITPGIAGSFTGHSDAGIPDVLVDALKTDRKFLLKTDAIWSAILILTSFGLILWGYSVPKNAKKTYASDPHIGNARRIEAMVGICLLVFVNMYVIGKRYLGSDGLTTPREANKQFNQREVDKMILEDKTLSYRVADLSVDLFNDSFNSFWHKSIGGYSPAKIQRYQDLMDRYIRYELKDVSQSVNNSSSVEEVLASIPETKVLSALNTKYFIIQGNIPPAVNPYAYGNAWFVEGFVEAPTPDDEIALIDNTDLRSTAIIGADFKEVTGRWPVSAGHDVMTGSTGHPADTIGLTFYSPNELHYHYSASADRPVVFSEIYYPKGWHASVDGVDLPLFRADWILRGAILPAGEHDIVMRFDPKVYKVGESVSRASSAALLALFLLACAGMTFGRKKE